MAKTPATSDPANPCSCMGENPGDCRSDCDFALAVDRCTGDDGSYPDLRGEFRDRLPLSTLISSEVISGLLNVRSAHTMRHRLQMLFASMGIVGRVSYRKDLRECVDPLPLYHSNLKHREALSILKRKQRVTLRDLAVEMGIPDLLAQRYVAELKRRFKVQIGSSRVAGGVVTYQYLAEPDMFTSERDLGNGKALYWCAQGALRGALPWDELSPLERREWDTAAKEFRLKIYEADATWGRGFEH